MRQILRILAGLTLAAGLSLTPAGGVIQAASPAAGAHQGAHVAAGKPARGATQVVVADGKTHISFAADDLASVLGVSAATLQQDLQAGQTLLQIAGSKYASANALATALLAPIKMKLDHAVAGGGFTADQAAQMYAAMLSDTETLVVTPHPQLTAPDADKVKVAIDKGQSGVAFNLKATFFSAVAASCHTTVDALSAALQSGAQSVLAACQATNPNATVDSLSAAISSAVRTQLDAAVRAGTITAAQETQLLAKLSGINAWLTTPVDAGKSTTKS